MSVVGEVTGVWGLLTKAWDWRQERKDPTYRCANRLIRAFEAHGIKRQQVMRLLSQVALPAKPELTMADFSKPGKLKAKLSPQLLDWAAEYLNVQRGWFDDVDVRPHVVVDHYKQPACYREWFESRKAQAPHVFRALSVWKGAGQRLDEGGCGEGPLCLVYEETSDGLDGTELSRYWLLSNEWSLHHAPCIENMVAAVAVAKSLGIMVTGREMPLDKLVRLEAGDLLLPEAAALGRAPWHPDDLVTPLPGKDSAWRQALWRGAQRWLGDGHQS
jgi:hypothetical protein